MRGVSHYSSALHYCANVVQIHKLEMQMQNVQTLDFKMQTPKKGQRLEVLVPATTLQCNCCANFVQIHQQER